MQEHHDFTKVLSYSERVYDAVERGTVSAQWQSGSSFQTSAEYATGIGLVMALASKEAISCAFSSFVASRQS